MQVTASSAQPRMANYLIIRSLFFERLRINAFIKQTNSCTQPKIAKGDPSLVSYATKFSDLAPAIKRRGRAYLVTRWKKAPISKFTNN